MRIKSIAPISIAAVLIAACQSPTSSPDDPGLADPDLLLVNAPYAMDLSAVAAGTTLDQIGFTGAQASAFEVNADGDIQTVNPGVFATVVSPSIGLKDRNENGGVAVTWQIRLPGNPGADNWKEKNKLYVTLVDDAGSKLYTVLFKPQTPTQTSNPNVYLTKGAADVQLGTYNTGVTTQYGDPPQWLRFRLEILPDAASGGTGEVKLSLDLDGSGYVESIVALDEEFAQFTGVQLTHRTVTSPNYTMVIRGLAIDPRS